MKGSERIKQQTLREKTARRVRKRLWQGVSALRRARSRPAFVVGSGRCGSTMLAEQLWESWAVSRYDGNHPDAYERWKLKDLDTIETLVRSSWAPVTLFKPMLDAYRTRTFLERFSDVRVVFAVRALDDVIRSSLRRFGAENRIGHVRAWVSENFAEFAGTPPPVETREVVRRHWSDRLSPEAGVALYWLFYNRLFYDLELDLDPRVRLVQYERVMQNPRREMGELATFLGIPFEENMLRGIRTDSVGSGSVYELPRELREECSVLEARLRESARSASVFGDP